MFPGFSQHRVKTSGAEINFRRGGEGPPLLLLHGYPQTHAMWHKTAPHLAQRFTVIAADLRGYGDSTKPPASPDHREYSKRAMALDMVEVMTELGWHKFSVAGHDRGGRVAYRLALDHPDKVAKLVTLDIVPTGVMWQRMNKALAVATYHWLFLAQPDGLPERMIGADPRYYLRETLRRWSGDPDTFSAEAMAEYERCFANPETIRAACEDYRAGASIDDEHDKTDLGRKRIACPMLALWGERGLAKRSADVLAVWRDWADDVRGHAIASGHFIPEEAPGPTLAAIEAFL